MKRIITLFIIFLSIFIFGCTTEKKQNNNISQSNIHTPSTLVVDPYSTSKFESLNFGDSLEKIKTLPTLIYYDEYPNSFIKSPKHKSFLFQTNANSYYNIPLIYDAPLLELSFFDNKLYKITARLDVKDEKDGLEKFEKIKQEISKIYGNGKDTSSHSVKAFSYSWDINNTHFAISFTILPDSITKKQETEKYNLSVTSVDRPLFRAFADDNYKYYEITADKEAKI